MLSSELSTPPENFFTLMKKKNLKCKDAADFYNTINYKVLQNSRLHHALWEDSIVARYVLDVWEKSPEEIKDKWEQIARLILKAKPKEDNKKRTYGSFEFDLSNKENEQNKKTKIEVIEEKLSALSLKKNN